MTHAQNNASFYDLKANDIDGNEVKFEQFKRKRVLLVNTASKCGFTKQYAGLQELHENYGGKDFVLIGFPSNDFLNQEPGSHEDIKAFCSKNYGVSFLMMEKVKVKGKKKHSVYQWLTEKAKNGKMDSKVGWNFQKYMISKDGEFVGMAKPSTKPGSEEIVSFASGE